MATTMPSVFGSKPIVIWDIFGTLYLFIKQSQSPFSHILFFLWAQSIYGAKAKNKLNAKPQTANLAPWAQPAISWPPKLSNDASITSGPPINPSPIVPPIHRQSNPVAGANPPKNPIPNREKGHHCWQFTPLGRRRRRRRREWKFHLLVQRRHGKLQRISWTQTPICYH